MTLASSTSSRRLRRAAVAVMALSVVAGALLPRAAKAQVAPTVTISPAAGQTELRTGDKVRVSFTGLPPGPVSVYQCADPAYLKARELPAENSCHLSSRVVGTAGADGSGTVEFPIWWTIKTPTTDLLYCHLGPNCALRVTTCAHTPEATGPFATIRGLTLEEDDAGEVILTDPETGKVSYPKQGRFRRPLPEPPSVELPVAKPTDRPKVNGAGGTGIQLAIEAWRAGSLGGTTGVDATYAPRFFDEGYEFAIEGSNDFAVSSVPLRGDLMPFKDNFRPFTDIKSDMTAEEQRAQWDTWSKDDLVYVPIVASPLDVIHDHAPFGVELERLDLDARTLARMYGGGSPEHPAVDSWSNPAIQSQNFACAPIGRFLGSIAGESGYIVADEGGLARTAPIRATNRSDASESNFVFREWLRSAAPEMASTLGPPSAGAFKDAVGKVEVTGSKDMANSFSALNENLQLGDITKVPPPGRIGHVDHAYAVRYVNRIARVKNGAGEYVEPNAFTATITLNGSTVDASTGLVNVGDGGTTSGAYPMVQVYYAAVSRQGFLAEAEQDRITALRDFLTFVISDEGQRLAAAAGYTPLTPAIRFIATAQIAKLTAPTTTPPPSTPSTTAPEVEGFSSGGFGSVSSGYSSGSYSGGYSGGSGGSDYFDSVSGSGDGFDGTGGDAFDGTDDSSVTVEEPSALEVLGETVTRPFRTLADVLTDPGRSPGLFALMVGGGASCVIGPALYFRRRPKRGAAA